MSKGVAAPPPPPPREAENVIAKIASEEKERKKERKNERGENGILQPGWIGATASSFSRCSDFEATTSLSLAENLRSDQRGLGVSDPRGEEEGREIVAKIVHRFLKTSRPLKATERLERAVNLDKSE